MFFFDASYHRFWLQAVEAANRPVVALADAQFEP
jgi:hypothetical protein